MLASKWLPKCILWMFSFGLLIVLLPLDALAQLLNGEFDLWVTSSAVAAGTLWAICFGLTTTALSDGLESIMEIPPTRPLARVVILLGLALSLLAALFFVRLVQNEAAVAGSTSRFLQTWRWWNWATATVFLSLFVKIVRELSNDQKSRKE